MQIHICMYIYFSKKFIYVFKKISLFLFYFFCHVLIYFFIQIRFENPLSHFLMDNFLSLFYIKSWTKSNMKIISIKGKKSECYSCVLCIMFTTLRLTSHVKEKMLHLLDIIYLFESVSLKHWNKEHITQNS